MMLGSIGLLLVGALYHTIRWGANMAITEAERIQILIVMLAFGSFYGLFLGALIGVGPRPARVGIGAAVASLASVFLLPSRGAGEPGSDVAVETSTLILLGLAPVVGGVLGGVLIPDLAKKFGWGESFFGPTPHGGGNRSETDGCSDNEGEPQV